MTGPEHYREAEKWAQIASNSNPELAVANAAVAQVHATLALAWATAAAALGSDWEGSQ